MAFNSYVDVFLSFYVHLCVSLVCSGRLERAVSKDALGMRPMSDAVSSGQMTPVVRADELRARSQKDHGTLEREAVDEVSQKHDHLWGVCLSVWTPLGASLPW